MSAGRHFRCWLAVSARDSIVVYSIDAITMLWEGAVRKLLHALMAATIALAVLVSPARAQMLGLAQESQQRAGLYATVVRDYGAAVRVGPSSDAPIVFNTACDEVWPVLATQGGWVHVRTSSGSGWIGGARVVVSSSPAFEDCSEARFLFPTGYVTTCVPTGCLRLRAAPSREAAIQACVSNGHRCLVVDGPFDPGTGEDWFRVSSPSTGAGRVLADHIYN